MEALNERISNYYSTRTKAQNGAIQDYLHLPSTAKHSICLCDNDYLRVANNEDVVRSQVNDLLHHKSREGIPSSLFLGDKDPHISMEEDFGEWFGKPCYFAQSGYAANTGLIHALCVPGTNVYADTNLHASFYDGLAARRVKLFRHRHNDTGHLEANIRLHGPGIILVESIYSALGTTSPLEEITRIKKEQGCVLVVDESHSLGLYGTQGKGYIHMKDLVDSVDYVTASLSGAFCCRAGVVFGPSISYIKEISYPNIFSSALTRNDIVRIRAMWEVVRAAESRRQNLFETSRLLRRTLGKVAELVPIADDDSPIVCIRCTDEEEMAGLHRYLSSKGMLVAPLFWPATPRDYPIIRLMVGANIPVDDVHKVANAVSDFYAKPSVPLDLNINHGPIQARL
ncbi:hypothetical protein Dda_5358 [Drechslerella dactyloides]|uniref:Aminotransferase class I/classII large domain-containing protein n=1 Tax=Drechslerella dactyloides TaxID=74499 RepID=A0AAD6NIR6_DREDA|nr:hypothetical protein Dda_5358 [Drechslerella dactyloides]